MENHVRSRTCSEEGFTLIELMVVVLILGILMAIAIPTFLGTRDRSEDAGALEDLRNGAAVARTFFTDGATYTGFDAGCAVACTTAPAVEPNLQWIGNSDPTPPQVAILVASGSDLLLVRRSDSGTYFCYVDQTGSGWKLGRGGNAFASVDTIAKCTALPAP